MTSAYITLCTSFRSSTVYVIQVIYCCALTRYGSMWVKYRLRSLSMFCMYTLSGKMRSMCSCEGDQTTKSQNSTLVIKSCTWGMMVILMLWTQTKSFPSLLQAKCALHSSSCKIQFHCVRWPCWRSSIHSLITRLALLRRQMSNQPLCHTTSLLKFGRLSSGMHCTWPSKWHCSGLAA